MSALSIQVIRGTILVALGVAGLAWLVWRTLKNAEDPAKIVFKWAITIPLAIFCWVTVPRLGVFGPFLIVAFAVVFSSLWTPHIGSFLLKPLTSLFDGGDLPPEPRPAYSVAQARQKQGKYLEAVAEIRRQLDRFPTDFEGHMLLAQIQAENLQDVPGAELTIQHLCAQPGHAPENISFALYSLADWQLKFAQDSEAAYRALQQIIDLLPDSEFALGAAQRIAHLPNREMVLAGHEPKKFALAQGPQNLGLVPDANLAPAGKNPEQAAAEYVRHLNEHPLDTEAREKLAVIYADHYGRLDLATEELEQMIQQPHQPAKLVVHWLNLMADLQIRCGADYESVRQTLERIIERDPQVAAAELARNRLARLRLELKANEAKQSVKLGTYEQNLGLKAGKRSGPPSA